MASFLAFRAPKLPNAQCRQKITYGGALPCSFSSAQSHSTLTHRVLDAGQQFGAFMTCATLIFALIGCLTRIRKTADTNFQKVHGGAMRS